MNIIDTRTNINLGNDQNSSIKNIPLFHISGIEYLLQSTDYTDIIFQSIPSVKFFQENEFLENKNIYSMGSSTKKFLAQKGINSICPKVPGSEGLCELLCKNKNNGKYLIK